jgi:hypothetical protein
MVRYFQMSRHLLGVTLACAWLVSGCSFLFVTEAPAGHARLTSFECTTSKLAPVLDTVGAVAYGAEAAVFAASRDSSGGSSTETAMAAFGIAALATVSAVHGYRATSQCAQAKDDLQARSAGRQPASLPIAASGCTVDRDCAAPRICLERSCIFPTPARMHAFNAAPVPTVEPPPTAAAPTPAVEPPPTAVAPTVAP